MDSAATDSILTTHHTNKPKLYPIKIMRKEPVATNSLQPSLTRATNVARFSASTAIELCPRSQNTGKWRRVGVLGDCLLSK